ncbi:MAG TPA: type IV secretory system conjugative DNA transfer family protein [Xanthobacteraceae bacterium]
MFLCLPARHMDTHDRWLRVIINLAVAALEPRRTETRDKNKPPVLLLLEEFPVLKHMEKLEAAAGQLAGSGVKLWVIVQNLGQGPDLACPPVPKPDVRSGRYPGGGFRSVSQPRGRTTQAQQSLYPKQRT